MSDLLFISSGEGLRRQLRRGPSDPKIKQQERTEDQPRERQHSKSIGSECPHAYRNRDQGNNERDGLADKIDGRVSREESAARELAWAGVAAGARVRHGRPILVVRRLGAASTKHNWELSVRRTIDDVRSFWERRPVGAAAVPYPPGSPEFFQAYDRLREETETPAFSRALHEYSAFRGRRVLDVGCGNGYVLSRYAQDGAYAFGVDLTKKAIFLATRRFELERLSGEFTIANAEMLPFASATFDCVCSMGVLHHTPDTARAVSELWRVLKPGGRLIVMFYHRDSLQYRWKFTVAAALTGKTREDLARDVDGEGNPIGKTYSRAELMDLLGQFGDVEIFAGALQGNMLIPKIGHVIPTRVLRPLERRMGWFLYAKAIRPG